MVSFETARAAAAALASPLDRRREVPLHAAAGRVLARTIHAPRSLPTFDQAAMDGYAVSLVGRAGLPLVLPVSGRTHAGDAPGVLVPGTAHRIMTGGALPAGADTVVMQEQTTLRGSGLVQLGPDIQAGTHIRRAGEDVRQGAAVLPAGTVLAWPEIALLAALGIASVPVTGPVRVGVLTTGSELRDAAETLNEGTVHDSNGPMLAALLAAPGIQLTSVSAPDDAAAITATIAALAERTDLLITTAGMSVGEEDHVRGAVLNAGGQLDVVKVAMKPGKPLGLGRIGDACFVGLPGNPQAAAYGALAFVRPMLAIMAGEASAAPVTARAAFTRARRPDRTDMLPVRLRSQDGGLTAQRIPSDGSHRMLPMVAADAIAIVPAAAAPLDNGSLVEILPFDRPRFVR
ncbi:gephyrin-like molybdotransferase Glp [Rhodopila sp.]|uniref:molybdopterin molybdotransferase MoeA n=1 Tax=Rhodopila sp. TaxID=2480087 RepID=UPI002C6A55E4|nr:gephyrin-like molybdotransferase Glp [Rhodopila sp.]HVZ06794.1 gephyrin-like molybdotransferase Glp [Rhodopila sp.]